MKLPAADLLETATERWEKGRRANIPRASQPGVSKGTGASGASSPLRWALSIHLSLGSTVRCPEGAVGRRVTCTLSAHPAAVLPAPSPAWLPTRFICPMLCNEEGGGDRAKNALEGSGGAGTAQPADPP